MMENWIANEEMVRAVAEERGRRLEHLHQVMEAQAIAGEGTPGLRARLAQTLVGLGLKLDADAGRSAFTTIASH